MNSRTPVAWYLGLILVVVVQLAIALWLIWIAGGEQIQVNQFYEAHGNEQLTDEQYRYWDRISQSSYQKLTVTAPTILTGAMVALFALLAVLAFRRERRRQRAAAAPAVEAPAAS
jgi:heme A synthase